ncbi:NrfD/PsrC family molybdoenzyme membrane anchor subunit [Jhaorihella thermophila]|uniref:Formate-dependent nitrite reductase, membrane component NrfD n=1 Tax=Jhaorihella thermophila TaxID=488547 RepID=A0A1H5ZEN3_9RHOB|nr:NrfD/PsrC family molybdoenzyme membrane anchor subunit [Jhaorihella thermophila]SEG34185.1 Formate-dependent nitrite reductase, membrane component NrfD [Jhaorihella thermophila]
MEHELYWGLPVILYLFLAGMGAGATVVGASMMLRGGGGPRGVHHEIARYGALLGPIPVIVGVAAIVFELGSWQAGHYFRFINLFLMANLSPMSVGSWLLVAFIVTSLMYAYTYLPFLPMLFGDRLKWRVWLAWINIPLGIGVAVYTGVLLGSMPSRPFWNSPMLAFLFLISALSTGTALIIFARSFITRGGLSEEQREVVHKSGYVLASADVTMIAFEILAVFLFVMFAYLTVGDVRYAIDTILPGGPLAGLFWGGVVLIGLAIPGLVELYHVAPSVIYKKKYEVSRYTEMVLAILVIVGGFLLRYVVVVAGQITGPVGV